MPSRARSLAASAPTRGTLEITVLDENAGPSGNAWVEVGFTAGAQEPERVQLRRADLDGRLRIRLAPGAVRLVAWSATGIADPEHLELDAGELVSLELQLAAGHEVAGRIFDRESGAPIPGAAVSFWTCAESDRVLTAADGTFRHPRFPAGAFAQQVRVEAPGYGPVVRYLKLDGDGVWKLLAATAGSSSTSGTGSAWIELGLGRELRLHGTVVSSTSRPIEGANVSAEGFFHVLPTVAARDAAAALTAAPGTFVLSGLRSDVGHSLLVRAPGFAESVLELAAGSTGDVDVGPIRLTPQVLLAGVVIDAEGQPVVDIEVVLTPRHEDDARARNPTQAEPRAIDVPVRVAGHEERTRTNADGTFLFEHLSTRPYELRVLRDNEPLVTLDVEPAPGRGLPDVVLNLPFDALTMTGAVSGPDGPLVDARVELERFGSVATATTDHEGRFRVAGLDDLEAYAVRVTAVCPRTGTHLRGEIEAWGFESPHLRLAQR